MEGVQAAVGAIGENEQAVLARVGEAGAVAPVANNEDIQVAEGAEGDPDEAIPERKDYNAHQLEIARSGMARGLGWRRISKENAGAGMPPSGVKTAGKRLEGAEEGKSNKPGNCGGKRVKRTDAKLAEANQVMEADPNASIRELATKVGLSRGAAARALKDDLALKRLTQMTMRRVQPSAKAKRLDRRAYWKGGMDNADSLDPRCVFFADEKVFRIGACAGGNQNYRARARNATKKGGDPLEIARREQGARQGGASVMCCMGVSRHGVGAAHLVAQNAKLNTENYISVLETVYLMDLVAQFGEDGPYIFTHDGASCHTSNITHQWRENNLNSFWAKGEWPPASPDLNAMDYFVWGWMQRYVSDKKPTTLLTLKSAVHAAAKALPLALVRKAVDGRCKRVALCVEQGGMQFKHRLRSGAPAPLPLPRAGEEPAHQNDALAEYEDIVNFAHEAESLQYVVSVAKYS